MMRSHDSNWLSRFFLKLELFSNKDTGYEYYNTSIILIEFLILFNVDLMFKIFIFIFTKNCF